MAQRETRKQLVLEQLYSDIFKQTGIEDPHRYDTTSYESSSLYNGKEEEDDSKIYDLYTSRETDQVKSRIHNNHPPLSIKLIPPSPTLSLREYRNLYTRSPLKQHSTFPEKEIYSDTKAQEKNVNHNIVPVYSHTEPSSSKTPVQYRKRQVVEAASVILHLTESEDTLKEKKQEDKISCDLFTSNTADLNQSYFFHDDIPHCRSCDERILKGGVRCRDGKYTAFFHRDCFTCSHYNDFLHQTE